MKKIFFSILLMLLLIGLTAKPLSDQQLNSAVNNFVTSQSKSFTISENITISTSRENAIVVYNLKPEGFVVLSTDDIMQPVLAYSFTNSLELKTRSENPLFEIFSEDTDLRMEYYARDTRLAAANTIAWNELLSGEIRDGRPEQQWPAAGTTSTDGWVETRWTQSGVYNDMCPLDNSNERSVVGCVATAMAMIMDFHKYIGAPNFNNSDSFTSYGEGMQIDGDAEERDFPTFEELNEYLISVSSNYANGLPLSSTDLAALNFAAGVSVEMMWSSDGSGAYTQQAAGALLNKFDYDSASAIENNGPNFYNILSQNMQNMQPAEISIYTSGWQNGHAIIVDGYNTDDYYHLNFGWGTSNNTCWYLLPEGMPSNYSIISAAVANIEGGALPISISGSVTLDGATAENTHIILEGSNTFETIVNDPTGNFDFDIILSGDYSVTAIKDNGAYYKFIENVTLNEEYTVLNISLDNFSEFTGQISAPVDPANTIISFYQDGELLGNTTSNNAGEYIMNNIIPGFYQVTASLDGNFFASNEINVDTDNQELDLELIEYSGDLATSFSSYSSSTWNLIPDYEMSVGVRIDSELEYLNENDVIAKMRFKAPISDDEGEIYPQLWIDNELICEMELTNFSAAEWIEVDFDNFAQITPDHDYFVGYRIFSETGSFAYQDNGPHADNYGGYTRISGWNEINSENNFCIEPVIISNNYGVLNGTINWQQVADIDLSNTIIRAGYQATHPDENGNFSLMVTPGTYDLIVETDDAVANLLGISVSENETLGNLELVLGQLDVEEVDVNLLIAQLHKNYPNPFNPTTTISFDLRTSGNVKLEVFNSRGQKIKTLLQENLNSGAHSVIWSGKDSSNNAVSSGVYFYRLSSKDYTATSKMLLLK